MSLDPSLINLPRLIISGEDILQNGRKIHLRGINLGGWLVQESWMSGMSEIGLKQSQGNITRFQEILESRFGSEKAETLLNVWYDNYLQEKDLDLIASYGFNFVRVPFSFRNFQDENGSWKGHKSGPSIRHNGFVNFSRLDWLVEQAAKRGMYTLLDFHVWYSRFEQYDLISINQYSPNVSPNIITAAQNARDKAMEILKVTVEHFKQNPNIWGIDMINEPTGSANDVLERQLYAAIRSVDPEIHIIMCWTPGSDPTEYGFQNVVLSEHWYEDSIEKIRNQAVKAYNRMQPWKQKFPFLVGEFHSSDEVMAEMGYYCNMFGFHWAKWTYKTVTMGSWGILNYYGSELNIDIYHESYDSLMNKWANRLTQWQNPLAPKNSYILDSWVAKLMTSGG